LFPLSNDEQIPFRRRNSRSVHAMILLNRSGQMDLLNRYSRQSLDH